VPYRQLESWRVTRVCRQPADWRSAFLPYRQLESWRVSHLP
jgi:hypothetical protein